LRAREEDADALARGIIAELRGAGLKVLRITPIARFRLVTFLFGRFSDRFIVHNSSINMKLLCKFRPYGGWGGIRTHERLAPLPVFKTGAFNRSATHPDNENQRLTGKLPEN
jgi:hypothetical protein